MCTQNLVRHFFNFIHRFGGAPTLHVFYHIVSDAPAPHLSAFHPVRSVQQFRRDLDWLLRHFMPVTLDELGDNSLISRPGFHVSFDGGLRQSYDEVRPILLEKGIPATFFIHPEFLDNHVLSHQHVAGLIAAHQPHLRPQALDFGPRDLSQVEDLARQNGVDIGVFLRDYQPYMTRQQVQSLAALGFTFGVLAQHEQPGRILDSLATPSRITGAPMPPLTFPCSDHGLPEAFWSQLPVSTQVFGCAGLKKGTKPNHFHRLALGDNPRSAAATVLRAYLGYWAGGRR